MKKYYWILIDTLAKTLEIVESESCQAATEEKIAKTKTQLNEWEDIVYKEFDYINNKAELDISIEEAIYDLASRVEIKEISDFAQLFAISRKRDGNVVSVIESMGGKVSGSVSTKTSFLINNDTESNSSKNKKAKQLGIPIISEQDFINMIS